MAALNLLSTTKIFAGSISLKSTGSFVTIVSNPAASGNIIRVHNLLVYALVANCLPTIDRFDGTTSFPFWNGIPIGGGQAYGGSPIIKGNFFNLKEGWSLRFKSFAGSGDCGVDCDWLEFDP